MPIQWEDIVNAIPNPLVQAKDRQPGTYQPTAQQGALACVFHVFWFLRVFDLCMYQGLDVVDGCVWNIGCVIRLVICK